MFYLIRLTAASWTTLNVFWGKNLTFMEISHQREHALLSWYRCVPPGTKKKKHTTQKSTMFCYQID